MKLVTRSQASLTLDLVSMLSFPVVFVSTARERDRINMAKRGCSIEDSNSDSETDREEPAEKIGRKYDGTAKYRVKYNPSWAKEYPVKVESPTTGIASSVYHVVNLLAATIKDSVM